LDTHIEMISRELQVRPGQISRTAALLAESATVPFISRYRKEATGGLDEVAVQSIKEGLEKLEALEKRRTTVLETIEAQGKLTDGLRRKILNTYDSRELEDLYLPYKPKRRTRASQAREKGLEPLAELVFSQTELREGLASLAAAYVNETVPTAEDALQGARDIVAEWVSEKAEARAELRDYFNKSAFIYSKVIKKKEEEAAKYRDYFDWKEAYRQCRAHRILAVLRGSREGFLRVGVRPDEDPAVRLLRRRFVQGENECALQVAEAVDDAYTRLLAPSLENELLAAAKEAADDESIRVFAENLRQLLLAPPMGQKRVLAIDPGYRTGCKVVCLDEQGQLLHHDVIFPHVLNRKPGAGRTAEKGFQSSAADKSDNAEKTENIFKPAAAEKILSLAEEYGIQAVAIGNGTAGRETEQFIRGLDFKEPVSVFMVNEDGASIYSASDEARKEFPDQDVTVRGAVSIGRRLMDPLSELVKIDPKSIGVGQYQHDVDQKKLRSSLDTVVESCVNAVGVNVNTAGTSLLRRVSGVGPQLGERIFRHRAEQGPFASRAELLNVSGMGPRAFEQCAGFLRIPDAAHPLDRSAVHPESYDIVHRMASDLNCRVEDFLDSEELRASIDLNRYVDEKTGLPTLKDIAAELAKPGRDPRAEREEFCFAEGVKSMDDISPGMVLPGIVTNITRFGAFVDIGVKQDGLVHISEMADRFVRDPGDVVKLQQKVEVKVLELDRERNRISLSMKQV